MKTTHLRSSLQFAAALSASALAAHAAPQSFDFKDPKGVNNAQFKLDAPLESITGTATGIGGTINFDVAQPSAISGRLTLDTASLTVGNSMMADHLRSAQWLDVARFPMITFEATKAANVRTEGNQVLADITGRLSIKGVSQEITIPVTFTHLANKLGARLGDEKLQGDLLVVRASFAINRSDFNILAGQMTDKVAETIHLSLSIAGSAPRN